MNKPSSLFHYTSFDAIVHILDYEHECLAKDGMIDFRFGNLSRTNDMKEIKFFDDYFIKDSDICNEIKKEMNEVKENPPYPYFMSLIHLRGSKWHYKNSIPMWYMYGDYSKGVRIAFEYSMLEEHCSDTDKGYTFQPCVYYKNEDMAKKASEERENIKKNNRDMWKPLLKKVYASSLFYKTTDWDYENEYRIIAWDSERDRTQEEDCNYLYVPLPIRSVREITIGPLADRMVANRCLNLIKEKLQSLLGEDVVHFDIKYSNLKIRK